VRPAGRRARARDAASRDVRDDAAGRRPVDQGPRAGNGATGVESSAAQHGTSPRGEVAAPPPYHHSGLMPSALTTVAHLATSEAMNRAKSCADPPLASALSLARAARISVEFSTSFVAALSLSTIAGGVPAVVSSPVHNVASSCG